MPKVLPIDPHRIVASGIPAGGTRGTLTVTRALGGKLLLTSFGPQQVHLLDLASGTHLGGFGSGETGGCWYPQQSSPGVVAAACGSAIRLWDAASGAVEMLGGSNGIFTQSVSWSADGRYLLAGDWSGHHIRLFDVENNACVAEGRTKNRGTASVALAPDGRRAASGGGGKLVHIWDPHAGREIASLAGHTGRIASLAFYPDGRRVVTASQDRTVRVWDLDERRQLLELGGHTKEVVRAVVSPDGKQLASCSSDGTVRLWNAEHGTVEGVVSVGVPFEPNVDYTSDGSEVVVAMDYGELRAFTVPPRPRSGRTRDELFDAVWANPDDDGPREVLADWLIEQGDPRGELIGLQLARARGRATPTTRERERALLAEHRREWLGPIASFIRPTSAKFERGFVVRCTLRLVKESEAAGPIHPAWSTVKRFATIEGSPPRIIAHLERQGATRDPQP